MKPSTSRMEQLVADVSGHIKSDGVEGKHVQMQSVNTNTYMSDTYQDIELYVSRRIFMMEPGHIGLGAFSGWVSWTKHHTDSDLMIHNLGFGVTLCHFLHIHKFFHIGLTLLKAYFSTKCMYICLITRI